MNRLPIVLGMLLASSAAIAQQPAKATADEVYQHRYTTAGYLRRRRLPERQQAHD